MRLRGEKRVTALSEALFVKVNEILVFFPRGNPVVGGG